MRRKMNICRIGQRAVAVILAGLIVDELPAQSSTAEVEAHNAFGSRFGNNGVSAGGGSGGGDLGSGTPSAPSLEPETFQAAFEVRTNTDGNPRGKQVKQDCAVCHRLSVLINGEEYGDGEAVMLRKGETHTVKVKDTPEPRDRAPGGDSSPPHTSNQKFTVWPKAVDGQTITSIAGTGPAGSPQVFIAKKEEILQYLLDNSEGLMAQDKDWPENPADEPMNKTARLLPIDIKVHQTKKGPQNSDPKYKDAPKAYIASNLFSVWPNEEAIVKIKLPPPFDQQANLPANLIKWEVPGHTIANNTLEAPLSWGSLGNSIKEVKITVGGSEFKLHFKVQTVGILSELEASALVPNASPIMFAYRQESIAFGTSYPAGPQDDAMRHAYWCSVSVSTFPVTAGDVELISTGHEYSNRYDDKQQAFNSTMDLKNNAVGMAVNHQANGLPDRAAIRTDLEQRYNAGEMYIWEIPNGAASRLQQDSEGIIIKSNGTRVY